MTVCGQKQMPKPENFPHLASQPKVNEAQRALKSGDSMKKTTSGLQKRDCAVE